MDTGESPRPRARRAAELFGEVLDLPEADREALLARSCEDPGLLEEVRALLEALPSARELLDQAPHLAVGGESRVSLTDHVFADRPDPTLGQTLGPWRVVAPLAAGGMGTVYRGERVDAAFRKQVAIKIIAPWLDTTEVVERFRRERQVLADLEHPHIARLLDGGTTADGRPYLVMEFIDGCPVDRYADEARLSVRERLRLFLTICDAVKFAHGNLIVHRDLKPSNILVDQDGQVKLLDFGIAKVLNGESRTEGTPDPVLTMPAALTPRYASPEQILGLRVTTATDVYSLGVLLFELLTGSSPYEVPTQLTHEASRIICETEPPRPSRGAARSDPRSAARRGQTPSRLARTLAGDLDTILLRALSKEPERRYASVSEFADDIRRYIDGLPVLAAPDRLGYRVGKFLRRHRALVMSTALTVVVLAVALAFSLHAGQQARAKTREAEQMAYASSLAAAESALRENSIEEAAGRLAAAPSALRGWEWRHLSTRLDRSLITVRAHAKGITCARFTSDGAALVTTSVDGTIGEWDSQSGSARRTWESLGSSVESLDLAADGTWFVAGLNDGRVVLVEREGDAGPVVFRDGGRWASVAISPDGRRLATAHIDGVVQVWDVETRRLLLEWNAHDEFALIAWVPNSDHLVSGGGNGQVRVWDASTGRELRAFDGHARRVYSLAVSGDGRLVVSGGMDQLAIVHDLATGKQLVTFRGHQGTVGSVAFTPEGREVVSCGPDGRFVRWDASTGLVLAELRGHREDVSAVAVSADGRRIASGDWGGTLKIWDASAGDVPVRRVESIKSLVAQVGCVAIDPSGSRVACGHSQAGLQVWPLPGCTEVEVSIGDVPPLVALAFTPNGRHLVAGAATGGVLVFDAQSWSMVDTVATCDGPVDVLAVHPSGCWVAAADSDGRVVIREFDGEGRLSRAPRRLDSPHGALRSLVFAEGGARLVGAAESTIALWDWTEPQRPCTSWELGSTVLDLAADHDAARLASIDSDGWLRTWSLPSGRPIRTVELGRARAGAIAWSRDGQRLAVGGIDGVVRLFDANTLRELIGLRGHVARVTTLAFAPGDACLVSGSRDGTVRIWTASSSAATGGFGGRHGFQ